MEDWNLEKCLDQRFRVVFGLHEKPLRISITVILLVLNVEFNIDMLPRLRKPALKVLVIFKSFFKLRKTVNVFAGQGIDAGTSEFVFNHKFY